MAGRRRCRAGISLVALLAGAIWVLVPALPASAATALTVTPNTGLTDGATVTVVGTGFVPGDQIGVCEAVPVAPASSADCLGGSPAIEFADVNGGFTADITVDRIFGPPAVGHLVDCADPTTPCVMAAADANNIAGTAVTVSLAFAPPPPPTIVPRNGSAPEGNSGTNPLAVFADLQNAGIQDSTVAWRTVYVPGAAGNQADPATDYTPASGTLTFSFDTPTQFAKINVNGDTLVEPDEYIFVQFGNPTNAVMAGGFSNIVTATIVNDDHAVVVPGVAGIAEGNSGTTNLDVPVRLSNPSTQTVTVPWTTVVVPGAPGNQADPATDYTPTSGTITFAPGATTEFATISVNGDTLLEPDEYIVLRFGIPTNAKIGGYYGLGFGTIVNDD